VAASGGDDELWWFHKLGLIHDFHGSLRWYEEPGYRTRRVVSCARGGPG
jgi:hypothetical protein